MTLQEVLNTKHAILFHDIHTSIKIMYYTYSINYNLLIIDSALAHVEIKLSEIKYRYINNIIEIWFHLPIKEINK